MSSKNGRKGYAAERAIEVLLQRRYPSLAQNILRPRAGSVEDKGDIHGLPVVISIKDWAEPTLGAWVGEMAQMCLNTNKGVGVVWHKRRGQGNPLNWYVTTDENSMNRLLDKFSGKVSLTKAELVPASKLYGWMQVSTRQLIRDESEVALLRHRQRGRSDYFVTTYGEDFLLMLDAYVMGARTEAWV